MHVLLFLFGSGWAFFLGVAMILAGFAGRVRARRYGSDRLAVLSVIVGLAVVALSAAPLPYWVYALAALSTLAWLMREVPERQRLLTGNRRLAWLRTALLGSWTFALLLELPYHLTPTLPVEELRISVIGDSVTAGTGDRIVTWPQLLAREGWQVHDVSAAGATSASAMLQAEQLTQPAGVVIVEIGGNDLLGSTSSEQFARDLDALLRRLREQHATILMFELPLPPLRNEYGRIQRRGAAKHGVQLLPKRHFMGVLADPQGTSDSIHLSQQGQQRMAALVKRVIRLK
jgi:acyl-CoA thioesterase-1